MFLLFLMRTLFLALVPVLQILCLVWTLVVEGGSDKYKVHELLDGEIKPSHGYYWDAITDLMKCAYA